jgi:hypothetical protein
MRRSPRARRTSLALGGLAAVALSAMTACALATSQPAPVDTSARALIYGHIDAPKPIQAVELAKMLSARRPSARVLENGDFFFEDVAPGDYGLLRFKAGNEWYLLLTGDKESNRRFIVQAKPGGMHFVGSWRVTGEKNNVFSPDEFSIERAPAPGERALLRRVRPALAGTGWEHKVGAGRAAGDGKEAKAARDGKAKSKAKS